MKTTIFYSWMSDLPNQSNKSFIEDCIKNAIKNLKKVSSTIFAGLSLDKDTRGMFGSPNIVSSIFKKIDRCSIVVCDLSFAGKLSEDEMSCNNNVLIELGYAIKTVGWDRIICLFNSNYGKIEKLPFDINHNRITPYNDKNDGEKKRITKLIENNVESLISNGKLYNPIVDYIKGKIDKEILMLGKNLANILFNGSTMSHGLANFSSLINLSDKELLLRIENAKVLGFHIFRDLTPIKRSFEKLFENLLNSTFFSEEWKYLLLNLIEWIRIYSNITSERFSKNFYICTEEIFNDYIIKDARDELIGYDSLILAAKINKYEARVINEGFFLKDNRPKLLNWYTINSNYHGEYFNHVKSFIKFINDWMEITGNEIILDPEHYFVEGVNNLIIDF